MTHQDKLRFLQRAVELAENNAANGSGLPFGAVIVNGNAGGSIVAEAVNGVLQQLDPSAHAEVCAIRLACRELQSTSLTGYVLFSSAEPCLMCAAASFWAGIREVYFAASRQETESFGFPDDTLFQSLCRPERPSGLVTTTQMATDDRERPFRAWKAGSISFSGGLRFPPDR